MKKCCFYFFILIIVAVGFVSCQKEINGLTDGSVTTTPANQFPKIGTTWTYSYYTFYDYGGVASSKTITHKAKSEETLGGEKWLKIVDIETDSTVYFLNTKAGGLYQFTNNSSNLLCKYPAAVNDTYNTFNGGATESFTVRSVNDTSSTGLGDIPLSMYEGVKAGDIIDLLWYNKNAWIVWKNQYKRMPLPPFSIYFLYSKMYIQSIVY